MWNKSKDENYPQRPPFEPVRTQPAAAPPPTPVVRQDPPTRAASIGASMTIKGEIRSREELIIEGEVEGAVESHSVVTIGPNGKVRANIKAREVVIYGSVRGNVEVSEKILIREKGSLVGDIKTAGIGIDDGAYFKGSIDIVRPEPKPAAKQARAEEREESLATTK